MGLFNRKREEDIDDEDELELETPKRKIRDLNPENRRSRKEPIKPWGAKERIIVLSVLLVTVLTSGILTLTARNFKLPKLPQLKLPSISDLNPFKEQVIVVGNKDSKISQEKIENTKKLFKEATNDYSGLYAFYIYDINGDYYYGYNHQETMQAASLIKLPVMYLAMKNGEDKVLVEAMGKRSENSAFNKMVNILGKENINRAILDLGMNHTSLSENETTPEEIGIFFKKLYLNEILNNEDSKLLQNYMTDTIFENWLRAGIPSDIKVIHKYGRELHSVSDAGIVMGDKPFVLVIMTDGVIEREADELFPKLTKLLYDEHTR
ncbi:MAG: serine hydrolase [Patescibacteria group bacterium]